MCSSCAYHYPIVQWSKNEQFAPEVGELIVCESKGREHVIPDLNKVPLIIIVL